MNNAEGFFDIEYLKILKEMFYTRTVSVIKIYICANTYVWTQTCEKCQNGNFYIFIILHTYKDYVTDFFFIFTL